MYSIIGIRLDAGSNKSNSKYANGKIIYIDRSICILYV